MYRRLILLFACCSAVLCGRSAFGADDPVTAIQNLTLQWTGLERQQEQLRAAWRRDEPVLRQQLMLLQREADELERVVASTSEQQDAVERRRAELLAEQTRFEQEQQLLDQTLAQAVLTLRGLQPQLPPPLQDGWASELPKLDDATLAASERLRIVLDLLGQLDAFDQKVTLHESVLRLESGEDWLVQQVYLGLARGWYLSADGRFAAAGEATPEGWRWQPLAAVDEVAAVIDILQRRRSPALVELPLQLAPAATGGAE